MLNRRNFIKTTALAANMGMLNPNYVFAARTGKTTGYFGVHPFVDEHPEAVFIMFTNVDVKTNSKANKKEGERFANEVIIPKDKSGIPVSHLIPIKPNITGGGGNTYETMGIITDPHFVEGVIEGMKKLGISKKQFHIREVNCSNWKKHVYYPIAKRTGADLHNMNGRVSGINNERLSSWSRSNDVISDDELQWIDVPHGVIFRKIPYLWPINAHDTFLLNIAKFKAHSMGLTLCCKNFQGAVANGYQHFCQKMGSVMTLPPEHRNPNVERDYEAYMKRHVATLPRWDRPINSSKNWVDRYDTVCQEIWTHRTLDNLSATNFGLHVVEGIYGRDGNFSPGPNPEGNENSPKGKAWDYMTNILIFGMDPFRVDIVGKWLGGHEPGNFGFFHIAQERGMLNVLNPMNIPVYHWHNNQAVPKPLTSFKRTPLKTYYLHKDYTGGNEPLWHLVNEPFDYSTVDEEKPSYPSKPGARVLAQINQTVSYPMLAIEYMVPQRGNVMLEILNDKGETPVVLVNSICDRGYHMASWNTDQYDSGKYAYRFRFNDYTETREILLKKS
ncbi:MAG: DUF362 domain-containing protein [Candidatus Latescibacteria bacterium]|jgi:hypothetical protein|nr:DUF362 domain-containing protein [Candidatus Latescibacterota bacterium]